MRTLCGRRIRLDDYRYKGTFARFYAYITEKSHTKNIMYFLDRGCVRTLRHWYGYATAVYL